MDRKFILELFCHPTLTQSAIDMWGIDTAVWGVDLDTGMIMFTNDVKGIIVTTPVQVIGTYDTEQDTWLGTK